MKMVILIPFALLKLRKTMKKERTPEKLEMLKKLIQDDIIGSIDSNLEAGNITMDDARKLKRLMIEALKEKEKEKKEALMLKDREIKAKEEEIATLKEQLERILEKK